MEDNRQSQESISETNISGKSNKPIWVGLVIAIVVIAFIFTGQLGESPTSTPTSAAAFENCVDDALSNAENCLLSGSSSLAECKSVSKVALEACNALQ